MPELLPVKVHNVVVDPVTRGFAVILRDEITNKWLPIYIGPFEAQAIAFELEGQKLPRPSTHDLIKIIFDELDTEVIKVAITDMREGTFYAIITIKNEFGIKDIDSRPSDAIAIALRTQAPIFVTDNVMEKSGMAASMPHEDEKTKVLREMQEKLNKFIEQENYEEAAKIRDQMNKFRTNKS